MDNWRGKDMGEDRRDSHLDGDVRMGGAELPAMSPAFVLKVT
ncbi:MAG: hypothetical protein ABR512_05945 [Desulfopila sp.]